MNEIDIPVFTLDGLKRGERMDELRRCAGEKGAFYLVVDGPLEVVHAQAGDAALTFFATATEEEKSAVTNSEPNVRRGFSALGSESTARCTNTGDYSDYAMVYSMGTSGNLFPAPAFARTWETYFDLYYGIAQDVARALLGSMDVQDKVDIDTLVDCNPVLRYRYFPDVPPDRCAEYQPNRMAPHYDLSIITLILQSQSPNGFVSLQVEVDGAFVDVPPRPGCVVVFCGSVAPLVSEGRIKAPQHRVVSPAMEQRVGSSRTSSVLFLRPRNEFCFSVPLAKALGMGGDLTGERATFGEWCGANYLEMHVGQLPA
ncbi:cephalosporin hydroxylase [Luteimonas sp. XNQY3]|nr:2OG-Fe(II) oxygenase family protein [Luteimonas sp. XNQY3]MCD9006277.1 cephalosporin hydroxylase [Luteimonas sp. XNQY3]